MVLTIGYLASALLAVSLIVSNAIKFRWLNIGGCAAFILYGILISAFPILLANTILFGINIFQIIKLYTVNEDFQMIAIASSDDLAGKFLSFYYSDIQKYFPGFSNDKLKKEKEISFVVLRDLSIATIFVAELTDNGYARVHLNYTVPKYRDYKVGRFIFEKEKEYLIQHGIKTIVYETVFNKKHKRFIEVMGFVLKTINNKQYYTKDLI